MFLLECNVSIGGRTYVFNAKFAADGTPVEVFPLWSIPAKREDWLKLGPSGRPAMMDIIPESSDLGHVWLSMPQFKTLATVYGMRVLQRGEAWHQVHSIGGSNMRQRMTWFVPTIKLDCVRSRIVDVIPEPVCDLCGVPVTLLNSYADSRDYGVMLLCRDCCCEYGDAAVRSVAVADRAEIGGMVTA